MISFVDEAHELLDNEALRPMGVEGRDIKSPAPRLESILESCIAGSTLSRDDALYLAGMPESELVYLLAAAKRVRERAKGDVITYSKNVFIPLTRLCRDNCGYCTFKIEPGEGELFVSPEEVVETAREGSMLGCTELLFVLGDKPEFKYGVYKDALARLGYGSTAEYLMDMCEAGLAENIFPHSNLGISTREELERLRETNPSMGLMLENISPRLLRRGEAHFGCPDKVPGLRMKTMEEAGELRIAWTSGILVGIGESWEERVDSLFAIKELDDEYGHIQEIIVQNFTPKPGIRMEAHYPPGALEMARTVAISRLIFPDKMNIQVPPNLNSAEFPLHILSGVNDLGGVSPITIDYVNPEAPWPHIDKMRDVVERLGLRLKERLPVYPEYISSEFLNTRVLEIARKFVDTEGFVLEEAYNGS